MTYEIHVYIRNKERGHFMFCVVVVDLMLSQHTYPYPYSYSKAVVHNCGVGKPLEGCAVVITQYIY